MSNKQLNIEKAIELYNNSNLSVKELCEKCNISTTCFYRNTKNKINNKRGIPKNIQDIIQEYKNNNTISLLELAKKYNTTSATLSRWLKHEGIHVRPMPKTDNKLAIIEAAKIYESGINSEDAARSTGISRNTLMVYLKEHNLYRKTAKYQKDIHYNENFFNTIDTEEKAYWLGFIFADGSVYRMKNRKHGGKLTIELSGKDKDHLEKFKKSLDCNIEIKSRYRSCHFSKNPIEKEMVSVSICSSKIIEDLMKYGCIPNKTYNGYIANLPDSSLLQSAFLRGFIDGDGYISKKETNYTIYISIHNKNIVDSIILLINNICGLIPNILEINEGKYHQYRIQFSNKKDFLLLLMSYIKIAQFI